jgi:hypothetical protein
MENDLPFIETKGYELYWPVAHNGYEIVTDAQYRYLKPHAPGADWADYSPRHIFLFNPQPKTETHSPWLISKVAQEFTPPRVFMPLSDSALHRKFSRLKTENLDTEVLNFAARYGILGRTANLHPLPSAPAPVVPGESLRLWRREIDKMGVLLAIWDLVRKEDAGKLGQIVVWPDSDAVAIRFKWKSNNGRYSISRWDEEEGNGINAGGMWAWDGGPQYFFELHQRGAILGPARDYVCAMVNHHLDGITPRLSPRSDYKIAFAPESLIDALWLLFMLELDGKTKVCWQCGNPFEALRKDKVYCTGACRRMAYYYRQEDKEAQR